ncbi:MAG: FtsQ-type POTRA domain-containing protein [Rhizomicrobium sp.]
MRSVKIDRKTAQPRSKSGRGSARASRKTPAQAKPFGRRSRPERLSRAWRALTGWLLFRRPMLVLSGVLLLAAFVVALFAGGYVHRAFAAVDTATATTLDDAGFGISKVHLAGNQRTPAESIIAALGFEPGQSIFGADVQTARLRLKKLPWVADADVRRRYPDDISVRIVEKLPFAVWQAPDRKVWVVERDGGLITTDGVDEFRRLPILAGAGGSNAADIVDAVATHRAVTARIRAYRRMEERRWDLILDDGVVVQLPETGWSKELDALEHLIIDKGVLERDVTVVDMRAPQQYFLTLKSGEKKTEPKGNAA